VPLQRGFKSKGKKKGRKKKNKKIVKKIAYILHPVAFMSTEASGELGNSSHMG